jgi:hypothetical protein
MTDKRAYDKSTFAIGGISSPLDSFVVAESFMISINIYGKKPAHRQSAKRYAPKFRQYTILNLIQNGLHNHRL